MKRQTIDLEKLFAIHISHKDICICKLCRGFNIKRQATQHKWFQDKQMLHKTR